MTDKTGLVILGVGGAGLLALALSRRDQGGEAPAGAFAGAGAGGDAPSPIGYSFFDPATGAPVGPDPYGPYSPYTDPNLGAGYPPGQVPGTVPSFSPDFERTLLQQNDATNQAIIAEQRKQTRSGNIEAGIVAAGTAAIAVPSIVRAAQGLVRPAAQAVVRTAVPSVATSPVVRTPFLQASGATVAGAAAAGVAVGTAVVYGLEKTGALDQVQAYGERQSQGASQESIGIVKRIALPLSVPGAVITGIAGRGSISGNLRKAFSGTNIGFGRRK